MIRNKALLKLGLYSFVGLMWFFYPGITPLLNQATTDLQAFSSPTKVKYKPQPVPKTRWSFAPQNVSAQSYLVIDLDSFTPILSQKSTTKRYPASLVKLATVLVSYKHYRLDQVLTAKKIINEEVKMGLVPNERITTLNLLYGALVYSANDAAYTLAENYPGGVNNFVEQMNRLAKTLGMEKTHYTNPIGFDNPNQYTTAKDLALLSRIFTKERFLLNLTSTKSITVSDINFEHFHYLSSLNELLGEIPHLGGLKTGTTDNAGQNLVTFYKLRNKPLLIILLKSEDRFLDTRIILDYLNQSLTYHSIS